MLLVFLLVLLPRVWAGASITIPSSLVQCGSFGYQYSSDQSGRFDFYVYDANSGTAVEKWPGDDNAGTYTWRCDIPQGTSVYFVVLQSGNVAYTSPRRTVQASSDTSCFYANRPILTPAWYTLYEQKVSQLSQGITPAWYTLYEQKVSQLSQGITPTTSATTTAQNPTTPVSRTTAATTPNTPATTPAATARQIISTIVQTRVVTSTGADGQATTLTREESSVTVESDSSSSTSPSAQDGASSLTDGTESDDRAANQATDGSPASDSKPTTAGGANNASSGNGSNQASLNHGRNSMGAIIGGAVGGAIVIAALIVALLFCRRRRSKTHPGSYYSGTSSWGYVEQKNVPSPSAYAPSISPSAASFLEKSPHLGAFEHSFPLALPTRDSPTRSGFRYSLVPPNTIASSSRAPTSGAPTFAAPPNSSASSSSATELSSSQRDSSSTALTSRASSKGNSQRQPQNGMFLNLAKSRSTTAGSRTVSSGRSSSPSLRRWRISDVPEFDPVPPLPALPLPSSISHVYASTRDDSHEEQIEFGYASSYQGSRAGKDSGAPFDTPRSSRSTTAFWSKIFGSSRLSAASHS